MFIGNEIVFSFELLCKSTFADALGVFLFDDGAPAVN